ncbi:MAG: hypothetical protein V4507_06565 [Verrucomicrobiota bacterium]
MNPQLPENDPHLQSNAQGKISLLLLWLIGIPVPILALIFLFRGCSS